MKLFILSVALFFCGCSLFTSKSNQYLVKKTKLSKELTVYEYKLPNKLTVLLVPNEKAPMTRVNHWVKAGSLHEKPGITGIAHLFEHMMFRPLEGEKEGIRGLSAKLGGETGANTRFGSTFYQSAVPHENLDSFLKLESDRFKKLRVSQNLLDVERKAVWSEYSMKFDANPAIDLWVNFYYQGFKDHPYEWMIIGKREDLEKISAKDCNEFFNKYYRPNNIGLVITGKFKPENVLDLVEKHYGNWEPGVDTKIMPVKNQFKGVKFVKGQLSSNTRGVLLGHRIPEPNPENYFLLEFVNYLLYLSEYSISKRVFELDKKMITSMEEFNFHYDRGTLKSYFVLKNGVKLKTFLNTLKNIVTKVKGLSDREFNSYKKSYQIYIAEEILKNKNLADWLSLVWGKYETYEKFIQLRNQGLDVTKEQVMSFLNKYYVDNNLIVAVNKNFK